MLIEPMGFGIKNNTADLADARSKILRARSLPSSRPFHVAAFFSALHFLGLIATVTATVVFLSAPNPVAVKVLLSGLGFSAFMGIIAFFKRRDAHCPLCKGTPLMNSGARPHANARRFYPLNHGMSATFSIIATQRFCCMYCGSDFDLLKTPSHRRSANDTE